MRKSHPICKGTSLFKISLFLQDAICDLAQNSVFEYVSRILFKLLFIQISAKQVQRVSEWYGDQLNSIVKANQIEYIPQLPEKKDKNEVTYVMPDGSMLNTREEKWKEIKLCRIFRESDNVAIQAERNEIVKSVFVNHFGETNEFWLKVERHLKSYNNLVFIGDGAKWIWKGVEDSYPGAIQILDYYHAEEKLEILARLLFRDSEKKKKWLSEQKEILFNDGVMQVIENIKEFKPRNVEVREYKQSVINYYSENEDRMMYKTFRDKGLLIGSGPIEAAHRSVLQQRLKLSGQLWTIKGAQAIANLRCYAAGGFWNIIQNLFRLAA